MIHRQVISRKGARQRGKKVVMTGFSEKLAFEQRPKGQRKHEGIWGKFINSGLAYASSSSQSQLGLRFPNRGCL